MTASANRIPGPGARAVAPWVLGAKSSASGKPDLKSQPGRDERPEVPGRVWTVTCGLPLQDNPLLDLLPTSGYTGPWEGDPRSGHLEVKTLNRLQDEGVSTEMRLLSRTVGWWMLKSIQVHPDDVSKLDANLSDIRQIIDSPLLSQPSVVRGGDTGEEEPVTGQILVLLPDASRLRCAAQPDG